MVKKSQWIWYRTSADVEAAFLFNCRQLDLSDGEGIPKGSIIQGKNGFVAAERAVSKVTGKVAVFQANRRCQWKKFEAPCMANSAAPAGQDVPRNFNYIVAELRDLPARKYATALGLPVVVAPDGKILVNLEMARFAKQDKNRRASLI